MVNTHDAKSRLSELIREAEEGIEVIVARNGRPVAKIVPWKPE
ncbi:MAG: type II toxin-antitoxin system Phd/YefM family antitoxin [Acidimicrobiales bacterium]